MKKIKKKMKKEGCPIDHEKMKQQIPKEHSKVEEGECPVKHDKKDEINPKNLMEANPNQTMFPGQSVPLPTDRIKSSIPKAGTENETWEYPSPQMFYNAMKRKGWSPEEMDMLYTVAIHNTLNEKAWQEIKMYEAFHTQE